MSSERSTPSGPAPDADLTAAAGRTENLPTTGELATRPGGGSATSAERSGGGSATSAERSGGGKLKHTRTAGTWAAVVVAILALVVLLIFILQNGQQATVSFLGGQAILPLGVAMLMSAAIGGLLVALIGTARILQLRRTARKRH